MFRSRASRNQPACSGEDLELFFPLRISKDGEIPTAVEELALEVCRRCPIQAECLDEELRYGARHQNGVVGGMTENQRRALLTRERVA